jgi:hypothetical protein
MDWGTVLAGAAAGLGAGLLGTFFAPWVQNAVEKRREQRAHRRNLIGVWRITIARAYEPGSPVTHIVDTPEYQELRPYLSATARARLEQQSGTEEKPLEVITGVRGIAANADLVLCASEVDRLEKEWGLR